MPSLVSALSALAVVSFALATPIWRANQTFTIYEEVPKPFVPGPVRLLQTYRKYGIIPSPEALAAAAASGSVTATPTLYDLYYTCPVTIGGQTLNLDFDTGSADLWVFSSELSDAQQAGHKIYDPSKSSTAQPMPSYTWSIEYMDESAASGNVYTDTVTVGATVIENQAVGLAQEVNSQMMIEPFDGILGLSVTETTIHPEPQNTFFENAVNNQLPAVFTADLKKNIPGSYDFGFIDATKYNPPITYVPLADDSGMWDFTYNGYTIGNGPFQALSKEATMDTGTSLIFLDESLVSAYWAQVTGATSDPTQNAYIFPCSSVLPPLTLSIGTYNAVIPGIYLNAYVLGNGKCYGGLQNDTEGETSILGVTFIKSLFVVFDFTNRQLGLAAKNLP